jgi:hypothetical protein
MILLDPSYWEVKQTKEKGKGIFAVKDIQPGMVIGDYIGKVLKTAEDDTSEKDGLYLLYYHDYASLYPEDITAVGIHLVNHSCTPNAWIYTYKGHTLFFSVRKIFAGEEITISYLLPPDPYCNPCQHSCFCKSIFCTGTMHLTQKQFEIWSEFHEKESKKTKRAPIRYGKLLPKLKEYPKEIEDNDIYTIFADSTKPPKKILSNKRLSQKAIRKHIRETGTPLSFPKLQKTIVGVRNNELVTN